MIKDIIIIMIQMYVKTPDNNVVILNGVRDSFRCRQRNKDKKDTFRFVSYKMMLKERKKLDNRVYGPIAFETVARL
jgi:hypothetical protein